MKKKLVITQNYKYTFNPVTGFFARWGETPEDDPLMSPLGPEIADIEISTVCHGIGEYTDNRKPCPWCYKSNTGCGTNMSFETFKDIFHKLPKNLTQIAFGIGDIDGNPDLMKIAEYCRNNDYNYVVPNITVNGMNIDQPWAEWLAYTMGAVAVSRYHFPDVCYDTIQKLSEAGLNQVNIHQLLSAETYKSCFQLLDDAENDPRLKGLNAIVFLMLKPKGKRNKFHSIEKQPDFQKLFEEAHRRGISIGMDSCSAPLMLKTADNMNLQKIIPSVEPCESTLFSIYINVDAEVFPCSFTEGTPGWERGIKLSDVEDFMSDVWNSDWLAQWRESLLASTTNCECSVGNYCRACPVYDITPCKRK